MRAVLIVLGDLGRSPRMLYHARGLVGAGASVDLIGYLDTPLPGELAEDPRIAVHALTSTRSKGFPYGLDAAWRSARLFLELSFVLRRTPRPDVILVQNPPAIPSLLVALAAARLRGGHLVIDWHNSTSSMLALRLGGESPIVRVVAWHEGAIGRRADANLFVSRAMKEALGKRWGLRGLVFCDRPAEHFARVADGERARIRAHLWSRFGLPGEAAEGAIVISPTSWTRDEDFDLLLAAVAEWEDLIRRGKEPSRHPEVLLLVTGRGDLREDFEARMARLRTTKIRLGTLWLEADEYARTLGAADLGICLHRSTSGFDLPMKIADLFGSGVPVCAFDYGPCLRELVRDGENGRLFASSAELANQLHELFLDFPSGAAVLRRLDEGVARDRTIGWQEAWKEEVQPLLVTP